MNCNLNPVFAAFTQDGYPATQHGIQTRSSLRPAPGLPSAWFETCP